MTTLRFPDSFLWGAATASYQIEGSPLADGAGPSIWHTFTHAGGNVTNDENGDVACDHYRRWREDVALMKDLGLRAYRFSIAWPRVQPTGRGSANLAGLGFYDRLVDALLEAGIEPMVTLYHWDLPQALEDEGGWAMPDIPDLFAEYAALLGERLGDRVGRWITFNEPWVFHWIGTALGVHAPGRNDIAAALLGGHHTLLAHGRAVRALRETARRKAEIGITLSVQAHQPASTDPRDAAAAARVRAFHNEWFADPIVLGDYPSALREQFGGLLPAIDDHASRIMREPLDFLGINYYTREVHRHEEGGFFQAATVHPPGVRTAMDWEIYPAGLLQVLREFHARYGLPLYVTENGAGYDDELAGPDGVVNDRERILYLQGHLEMCHRAISEGIDLRGYMAWSLLDNFEWAFGYAKRFGLVRCEFESGRRTPKLSAGWYRRVIEAGGL